MRAHPDGCPDEPDPAVEVRDQLRSDAVPLQLNALDALDVARRDAAADGARLCPHLAGEAVEKLVALEPDAPARDASFPHFHSLAGWAQPAAAAELYTQVWARSAERSCAAQVAAEQPEVG